MSTLLPLFPLGTVLFPGASLPLHVFEPRYRALVHDLLSGPEPREFGVVAIREGREVGADGVRELYDVGCVARVEEVQEHPDGRFGLLTTGTWRFRLRELDHSRDYVQATVDRLDEPSVRTDPELPAAVRSSFLDYVGRLTQRDVSELQLPADETGLSYAVAAALPLPLGERQELLEASDVVRRLDRERQLLERELALLTHLRAAPLGDAARVRHTLN